MREAGQKTERHTPLSKVATAARRDLSKKGKKGVGGLSDEGKTLEGKLKTGSSLKPKGKG